MKRQSRLVMTMSLSLGMAGWCILAAETTAAPSPEGPQDGIRKIADALQKGDTKAAQSAAKTLAEKSELEDIMHMFSLRTSKGEGVGAKAGAIKPDGIEAKIQNMTKRVAPAELKNDGEALQRMAYLTAAIGEVIVHKAPKEKKGEMDPAKWVKWSEEMSKSALDLAKEVKSGDPMKSVSAAKKLDSTCKECHGLFRDS